MRERSLARTTLKVDGRTAPVLSTTNWTTVSPDSAGCGETSAPPTYTACFSIPESAAALDAALACAFAMMAAESAAGSGRDVTLLRQAAMLTTAASSTGERRSWRGVMMAPPRNRGGTRCIPLRYYCGGG